MTEYRINPDLDVASLADRYKRNRRVRVDDLLAPEAVADLHAFLDDSPYWYLMVSKPGGVHALDRAARARLSAADRQALEQQVLEGARTGFQYRNEALRLPDDATGGDPLSAFSQLMGSEPMLGLLRRITGSDNLAFADGHAAAYGPGDFLTGHDDNVAGKSRVAAYVFGLTSRWRPEWGGLLLFHEGHRIVHAETPAFNTLDLFAVPQQHSVSYVTPSAPYRRLAITGWLHPRRAAPNGENQ